MMPNMRGLLARVECVVEVKVGPTIVTHACVSITRGMGVISQHSHMINTPSIITLCARNNSEIGKYLSTRNQIKGVMGPLATFCGERMVRGCASNANHSFL